MTENNQLVKPVRIQDLIKRPGIQGLRAQAQQTVTQLDPLTRANRFTIGFDDSGSMAGEAIKNAKLAVAGFLASCNPMETSVAIYPFCEEEKPLSCLYDLVNMYVNGLEATGGTPLYGTMIKMLTEGKLTRGILFSDGGPTDSNTPGATGGFEASGDSSKTTQKPLKTKRDVALEMAIAQKIPFDTIYIGEYESKPLKEIADATGGTYLRFTDSSVFSKQMKYLSPKYYALLSNAELKKKIEKGETI